MKRIFYASSLLALAMQPAFAKIPVTISGPSPAIAANYSVGSSNTITYTIYNNVPGGKFPITVSGMTDPVSRVTVANDCGNTLPRGPATCNIGILIAPTTSSMGQSFNQFLSIDYQGRYPLTGNIAFSVSSSTPPTSLVIYQTTVTTNGTIGGVTGADAMCQADSQCPTNATCKAVLSDGTTRTANPILNWVLQPSTQYNNTSAQVIGTTTSNAVFDFPLTNSINTGGNAIWTGLNADWTSNSDNCTAWTDNGLFDQGEAGLDTAITSMSISDQAYSCQSILPLYCAQQP